uniref:Uncharacterized protein n=1 Tax=Trichuris muris TaxID=70415 RepID=A0A5S6Q489_TRIMR
MEFKKEHHLVDDYDNDEVTWARFRAPENDAPRIGVYQRWSAAVLSDGTVDESTTTTSTPKWMHDYDDGDDDDDGAGAASGSGRFPGAAPVSSFYDSDSIKRWHLSQRNSDSAGRQSSAKVIRRHIGYDPTYARSVGYKAITQTDCSTTFAAIISYSFIKVEREREIISTVVISGICWRW